MRRIIPNLCLLAMGCYLPLGAMGAPCADQEALAEKLEGLYAHLDLVAYVDPLPVGEMRSIIVTYGLTQLERVNGELISKETFCSARQVTNLPMKTSVSDAFTQAIQPPTTPVEFYDVDGICHIIRPETPTPIGIRLDDPLEPLPQDRQDPRISDDDGDGKPGVSVDIKVGPVRGRLYIARREIFSYDYSLKADGHLEGVVRDRSEQLILGSSWPVPFGRRNPKQHPDLRLSPIQLIPVGSDFDCAALSKVRDQLFPKEIKVW